MGQALVAVDVAIHRSGSIPANYLPGLVIAKGALKELRAARCELDATEKHNEILSNLVDGYRDGIEKLRAELSRRDAEIDDLKRQRTELRAALASIAGEFATVPPEYRDYWKSQLDPDSAQSIALAALSPAAPAEPKP